jgi:hypothetical protein
MFDDDMDPRMQAALAQVMNGPAFSQVWLAMVPHAAVVVQNDGATDPAEAANSIDTVARKLTERFFEMFKEECEEAQSQAELDAPEPLSLAGHIS